MKHLTYHTSYLFIIFGYLLIYGCNNRDKISKNIEKTSKLHFDVSTWEKGKVIPSNIIKDIEFIPLETNNQYLLGEIVKIIINDENIYIKDRGFNQVVFVFNINGKYLNQIGKRGKGPGEFLEISDFVVDRYNAELLILDLRQKKIIKYNLKNGEFKYEIKLNFRPINFVKLGNDKWCFYSNLPNQIQGIDYSITLVNDNFKVIDNYLPKNIFDTYLNYPHALYNSECVYFATLFQDTIYKITDKGVIPAISFNFGENKISEKKLLKTKNVKDVVKLLTDNNLTFGIKDVIEDKSHLSFNLDLQKAKNIVIFSKQSGNYFYGERYGGILYHFNSLKNLTVNNEKFFSSVDAFHFKQIKNDIEDSDEFSIKNKYLNIYNRISNNANPILIAITYHNF